ncbi:CHAT domain-containing protein [Ekhidna sp.]|uniref:CHAT domain-containing protein n=1 Tax=Ekhidna sp. TaxID=2608089 RepID=UPI003B5C915A
MKKNILIFYFFIGLNSLLQSQSNENSTETALQNNNPDRAIQLISLQIKEGEIDSAIFNYLKVANHFVKRRNIEESLKVLTVVDSLITSFGIKSDTISYLLNMTKGARLVADYNPESIAFLKEALKTYFKNNYSDSVQLARIYGNIGNSYFITYRYDSSKNYYVKLARLMNNKKVEEKLGIPCYWSLGLSYNSMGLVDSSIYSYNKALTLVGEVNANNAYTHISINTNKSSELRKIYRIEEAFDEISKNDSIIKSFNLDLNDQQILNSMFEMALVKRDLGKLNDALMLLREIKAIESQKYDRNHITSAYNHYSISETFYQIGQYDSALFHLLSAYHITENQETDFSNYMILLDRKLGDIKSELSNFSESLRAYKKAYLRLRNHKNVNRFSQAAVELEIANVFFRMNSYDSSKLYIQKSLENNCMGRCDYGKYPLPSENVYSIPLILKTLVLRLQLEIQRNPDSQETLELCEVFMKWRDRFDLEVINDNDLLQLINLQEELISLLLHSNLDNESIFPLVFKLQEINQNKKLIRELEFRNTKKSILNADLKHRINSLDQSIGHLSNSLRNDSSSEDQITSELNKLKRDKITFLDQLKIQNPNYFNIRYGPTNEILSTAKSTIGEDQILIRYIWVGEKIWITFLTQNDYGIIPVDWENAESDLSSFLSMISQPDHTTDEVQKYQDLAFKIHQKLLLPMSQHIESKNLIIYPDKALHYLPFEALVIDKNNSASTYTDLNYLIKNHSVIYENAVTRKFLTKKNKPSKTDVLVFSPEYENFPLPWASEEIKQINKSIGTTSYVSKKATIVNFLDKAPKHSQVHFLGHGFMNAQDPLESYLLFSKSPNEDRLSVRDIYKLKTSNSLLVLSACETGVGEYINGEGVVSLTRAFFYAGVECIVMSLWKINDMSTTLLMGGFYKQISNGKRIDESLRISKLELIKRNNGQFAHPYYWAGFIVKGNSEKLSKRNNKALITASIISFIFIFLLYRRYHPFR